MSNKQIALEEELIKRRLIMTNGGLLASCLSKNINIDTLSQKEVLGVYKAMKDYSSIQILKKDFVEGSKWQPEIMYSEQIERLWNKYRNYTNNEDAWSFKEWLVEQFKKQKNEQ